MRGYDYGMGQQTGGQKGQDEGLSSRSQVNCSSGVKTEMTKCRGNHISLRALADREVPPAGGYGEEAVCGAPAQMAQGDPRQEGGAEPRASRSPPDLRWQH